MLAPRGTVLENGMPRFFRRLREGVFDEDDLRARADELAAFLAAAEQQYGVTPGSWVAVGFSNGANIASALLLRHPEALSGAVLLAAMVPFQQDEPGGGPHRQTRADRERRPRPDGDARQTWTLAARLRGRGADVDIRLFPGGHTIDPGQLPHVKQFLEAFVSPRPG